MLSELTAQEQIGVAASTVTRRLKEQKALRERGYSTFTIREWQQYRDHATTIEDNLKELIRLRSEDDSLEVPDGYRSWKRIVALLGKAKSDAKTADDVVEAITQASWNL